MIQLPLAGRTPTPSSESGKRSESNIFVCKGKWPRMLWRSESATLSPLSTMPISISFRLNIIFLSQMFQFRYFHLIREQQQIFFLTQGLASMRFAFAAFTFCTQSCHHLETFQSFFPNSCHPFSLPLDYGPMRRSQ